LHKLFLIIFWPFLAFAGQIEYLDIAITGPLRENSTVVPNTSSMPPLSAIPAELTGQKPSTFHFIKSPQTQLLGSARYITPISPLDKKIFSLNTQDFSATSNPCTLTFETNFQRYLDVTVDGFCHEPNGSLIFLHEARRSKIGQIHLITTAYFNLLFAFQGPAQAKNSL
jgi:hypothetical protein